MSVDSRSRSQSPVDVYMDDDYSRQGASVAFSSSHPYGRYSSTYPITPESPDDSHSPRHHYNSHSPLDMVEDREAESPATTASSSKSAHARHASPSTPYPSSSDIPKVKGRKHRLDNLDRKKICLYAEDNPGSRQEDIAQMFDVERSTVSKILKHKARWLHIPDGETIRIKQNRSSKFPMIESKMEDWLPEASKGPITDNSIREKAKEIAGLYNIGSDKFKASSGWVENFKSRHGIRRGQWNGEGTLTRNARALGLDYVPEDITRRHSPDGPPPSLPKIQDMFPDYNDYSLPARAHAHPPPPHSHHGSGYLVTPLDDDPRHSRYQPPPRYSPSPEPYDETAVYAPVPEIPDNFSVPAVDQAERHLDKVMLFCITPEGREIITDVEYEQLRLIKIKIFQAAAGIHV